VTQEDTGERWRDWERDLSGRYEGKQGNPAGTPVHPGVMGPAGLSAEEGDTRGHREGTEGARHRGAPREWREPPDTGEGAQ